MDKFLDEDAAFCATLLPKRKSKRVKLVIEPKVLHSVQSSEGRSRKDHSQTWWQREEYQTFKKNAKNKCRQMRRVGLSRCCLTDAYETCEELAASGNEMESANVPTILAQQDLSLVDWCAKAECLRGLERWASKRHGEIRGHQANMVKKAVMTEQIRQSLLNERDEGAIAKIAACASKPSRNFARLMGEADAVASSGMSRKRKLSPSIDCRPISYKVPTVSPDNSSRESPTSTDSEHIHEEQIDWLPKVSPDVSPQGSPSSSDPEEETVWVPKIIALDVFPQESQPSSSDPDEAIDWMSSLFT